MDALISGRSGVALVVEGGRLATIHAHEPNRLVPRHPGEARFLVGEAQDFFPVENASQAEIGHQLTLAKNREEALSLALMLLDPDLSGNLRSEVAEDVDALLEQEDVLSYVEGVLYSKPLPAQSDLAGGLTLARGAGAFRAARLLELLDMGQYEIRAVREAWDAIPSGTFQGERERWRFIVVRESFFRKLVLDYADGRSAEVFLRQAAAHPALRSLPNLRGVLRCWISPLVEETLTRPKRRAQMQAGFVSEPDSSGKD